MCLIRQGIPYKEWTNLRNEDVETLWISLRPPKLPRQFTHITIGVIYHPPDADNRTMINHICQCLDYILQHHPRTGIILSGDFNHLPERQLKAHYHLKQIVTVPTRGEATLDKIYTNMDKLYRSPVTSCPIGSADHDVVICQPYFNSDFKKGHSQIVHTRVMGHNERVMFATDLQRVKWEVLYRLPTCEDQLQYFTTTIHELIEKHFPQKTVTRHTSDKPWVTDRFRDLIRRRQQAWMSGQRVLYRFYRNKVNRLSKTLTKNYYDDCIAGLHTSKPRNWWKGMKELLGFGKSGDDNALLHLANQVCDGSLQQLAEIINNFFKSVSDPLPPLTPDHDYLQLDVSNVPAQYIISVDEVEQHLRSLNIHKAPGPDALPTWILRDFSTVLAGPVAAIYNSSLREGHVPEVWRSAFVSPLAKKHPPEQVEKDLRPISLTPILCKEMEDFIVKWVWELVLDEVDPNQYGSVKGSSTTHALVDILHQCYTCTDASKQFARILLLDYSKAFDLINHSLLLKKLEQFQLPNVLLKWITSFLLHRKQQVRFQQVESSWNHIHGGVPQGTKLGPVLFVLMINDLQTDCHSYKYVDDTSIVFVGSDPQATNLQDAADTAYTWSQANDMKINATKTKEIIIDFSKTEKHFLPVTVNGTEIERVSQAKVLGITISNDLTWDCHVNSICKKAGKRLYLLLQLKRFGVSTSDLLMVYITIIRPTVEYACPAWATCLTKGLVDDLERVQRRALSIIFPELTYTEALHETKLCILKDRRFQLCSSFFTKLEHPSHKLHKLLPTERDIRYNIRNSKKYPLPKVKTNRAKNTFINWCLFNLQ